MYSNEEGPEKPKAYDNGDGRFSIPSPDLHIDPICKLFMSGPQVHSMPIGIKL